MNKLLHYIYDRIKDYWARKETMLKIDICFVKQIRFHHQSV